METLFDPSLWAHPGHGQVQGLMALTLLLVAAPLGVVSAAASRLRPNAARAAAPPRPPPTT